LIRLGVTGAIDFNHQSVFSTKEIKNKPIQRVLPPELEAAELFSPYPLPQFVLLGRQRAA
jgi:hypothetical protein